MRAAVLLILVLTAARLEAQPAVGQCAGVTLRQNGVNVGCLDIMDLGVAGFAAPICTGTSCIINLSNSSTLLGSCIGATTSFCGTVDFAGKIVDAGTATSLKVPVSGGAGPTAAGLIRQQAATQDLEIGDGTRTRYIRPALPRTTIGGLGTDGAFTYAGEGAGACSGDVCRGGTCTGTTPTGTCTLTLNAQVGHHATDVAAGDTNAATGFVGNYTTFAWTAGTLTVSTANASVNGRDVAIRTTGDMTFSGTGTLNLRGLGSAGGTATGTSTNAAGKNGGATSLFQRIGATGAGKAGFDAPDPARLFFALPVGFTLRGTGGGAGAGATTNPGTNLSAVGWFAAGASGGTGGGCTGTTATPGNAGAGGGFLLLEVGGSFACSGVKVDVRGADGGIAGGGGGGGGVFVLARVLSGTCVADTAAACSTAGRVCTAGGAAGASSGVCSAGGAGGVGVAYYAAVPQ